MEPVSRRDLVAMIAIVAVGCAVVIVWGERIGVHNGEGWDGMSYAAWARDFPATVREGVTSFQSDRVLPSAVIYYALGALGIDRTPINVIHAFQILDALTLVASAWLLGRIAVVLRWSRAAAWVAFVATFFSFASARHALYYPTMTDQSAYVLAMTIVWAFLARRPIVLWVATFASAFTWPALVLIGVLALVFPRASEPPPATTGPWHRRIALGLAVTTFGFVVYWCVFVLVYPIGAERWIDRSDPELWPLTIACVAIPCALAAYIVARHEQTWSVLPYLRTIGLRRIALGIAAVVVIIVAREVWRANVGTKGLGFGWRDVRHYYVATAIRGPLWGRVHDVVYFGPIIVLVIAAWRPITGTAARWGPAALLALGIIVMTSVAADSRHLLHVVPFIIVVTVESTRDWWTPRSAIVFAVLGIAWSKLWWRIGYVSIHDSIEWPDLRWFMHFAPWASYTTYLVHGAAAVITAIVLWLVLRRPRAKVR